MKLASWHFGYISSFKCVILMRKLVNLKLEWMKNYDTKKKKKPVIMVSLVFGWFCSRQPGGTLNNLKNFKKMVWV